MLKSKVLLLALPMAMCAITVTPVMAAEQAVDSAAWRSKIGNAVREPALVRKIMSQLKTKEEKTAFVAALNKAIESLPDGREVKSAYSVAANTAAVEAAGRGDRLAILSEVFATASCESLTVINEEFATKLFNRDTSSQMTDAEYKAVSTKAMNSISERCATAETPAVRETLAALMFINATPSSSAEFKDSLTGALLESVPSDKREVAAKTWVSSALGTDRAKSYGPLLGEVEGASPIDADAVVSLANDIQVGNSTTMSQATVGDQSAGTQVVLQETPIQITDSMLGDLTAEHTYQVETPLNNVTLVEQTTASKPSAVAQIAESLATPGTTQGASGTATVPRDWVSNPVKPDGTPNEYYSTGGNNPREPIWYNGQIIGYK